MEGRGGEVQCKEVTDPPPPKKKNIPRVRTCFCVAAENADLPDIDDDDDDVAKA
jgi:hypothetical protein